MDQLHHTLRRVEEYASLAGTTPAAVCRAATGNPRLYDRLKRRADDLPKVLEKIEAHMDANPPSGPSGEAS